MHGEIVKVSPESFLMAMHKIVSSLPASVMNIVCELIASPRDNAEDAPHPHAPPRCTARLNLGIRWEIAKQRAAKRPAVFSQGLMDPITPSTPLSISLMRLTQHGSAQTPAEPRMKAGLRMKCTNKGTPSLEFM